MNEPPPSFIPMLPRWRLPLGAPMHLQRVQQRMSATSSSDSDQSLNRLRELQRSIMQRRSRIPRPPVVPRNEGKELAEALFPGANPAAANSNAVEAGTSEVSEADAEATTIGVVQNHQEVVSTPVDETSDAVPAELGGQRDANSGRPAYADAMAPSQHGWASGMDSGAGMSVQASWHVTASTRPRDAGPVGISSLFAKDDTEGGDADGNGQEPTPSASGKDSESATGDAADDAERDMCWNEDSKRPRKRTVDTGPSDGVRDSEVRLKTAAEKDPVDEPPALDQERSIATPEALERDMSELHVMRQRGCLPWKSAEKQKEAIQTAKPGRIVDFPDLSVFTSDPDWSRKDWSLPRRAGLHLNTRNVMEEDVETKECNSILDGLNELQTEAVLADPEKACLVLAGPGSGKTRVLTHRVAYLVKKYNVSPYRILAVTFTNKAAEEMKERVSKLLRIKFAPDWAQEGGPRLALGTFHSVSARILRKHGSEMGIASDFMICDTSDSRQVVSRILKRAEGSTPDSNTVGEAASAISKLKNDKDGELRTVWSRPVYRRMAELRALYDEELRSMNHLDFDDLLLETRKLLHSSAKVRDILQDTYEHVLVDEWQDTNHVQFDLVSLLCGRKQNLFVVGDADQSIYKFRGADSGNLERFMEAFPNAVKITLEQNYRSSGCIVAAAQSVIEGNTRRISKKMTTLNEFGSKVTLRETIDDRDEAQYVVSTLSDLWLKKYEVHSLSDVAILYRTNAQSRLIEEACIQSDIPYRVLSGTKFYDRQEIRDLVAYLRILSNPADNNAFRRIVNIPPRGIGKKTQDELEKFSESRQLPLLKGLDTLIESYAADEISTTDVGLGRAAILKLADFQRVMNGLRKKSVRFLSEDVTSNATENVDALLTAIIEETGYREYLQKRDDRSNAPPEKAMERLGNIEELVRAASRHTNLHKYLEGVTLMVDTMHKREAGEDTVPEYVSPVSLMTLHGGKGLEFGVVFIIGVEDGIIPISRGDKDNVEEERRLFYVGMTRAKEHLYITWRSKKLVLQGGKPICRASNGPSRFLDDIPEELVHRIETWSSKSKGQNGSEKEARSRRGRRRSEGRLQRERRRRKASKLGLTEPAMIEWRAGDCVRCSEYGRGTVTIGAPASAEGAWIEVLFADGARHFVNTIAQDVELLFSPSS